MNCQDFNDSLYDYLDETLGADAQSAARAHLRRCGDCRRVLLEEETVAKSIRQSLDRATADISLGPEFRRDILTSLDRTSRSIVVGWRRFAWPLGIAASLLLAATIPLIRHFSGAAPAISVETSYQAPTRIFRREANTILDTMSYKTVAVSETLWTGGKKP